MPRKTPQQRVTVAQAIAVDAVRDPETYKNKIPELVGLSLIDYYIRFPDGGKPTSPWLFYDGNPKSKTISRKIKPDRVDVYCLFCRVMLVTDANMDFDYSHRIDVRNHTTNCALRCLARLMEPGAPYTYRLPEEL